MFVYFTSRVPISGDNRTKWIEAIEKHQRFDNRPVFNVCKRHFQACDLSGEGNKLALNVDAVPLIFEKSVTVIGDETDSIDNPGYLQIIGDGIIDDAIHANNQCIQCPFLKQKAADLNKQIFQLKALHNVETQKFQRQIDLLQKTNEQKNDQVKQFRKDLSQEKTQNIGLKDVISELKSQNFISTEDEKILNVCCLHIDKLILFKQSTFLFKGV